MSRLSHADITTILLALGLLLATARILGELATRLRQPAVIGEILAGILLGPTVLARISPQFSQTLFPVQGNSTIVLQGIATVSVVLFLLSAGMEVDLSRIFRQGKAAMSVSISGIAVPFAIGLTAAWAAPDLLGRSAETPIHIFALFFATVMSISALPVIAKTLMDLNLYRSDVGMVVIAAAIFDDLAGWIVFAVVLGMITPEGLQGMWIGGTIGLTLGYVLFMLTIGRWLIHQGLPWLQAHTTWPSGVLALAMVLAFLGAAFTDWIGVHAAFGSFMAGVALGDSPHLRERTRATIHQFVSSVFAPLFFATIGLRVDFVTNFDWLLVVLVLAIAMLTKVGSCGFGARLAGMSWRESWAVGFGMNARGAMGIILGLLALEAGVIDEKMFVALFIMAVVTSMLSGSMMELILRRPRLRRFASYLHPRGFINPLKATNRDAAIQELALSAAAITGLRAEAIASAVLERERMMPTGVGLTVAVPHARIHGVTRPLVCLGISPEGVEFSAPDGERSRMVFLILTAAEDDGAQLEILADVARTFLNDELRGNALRVGSFNEFLALLKTRETRTITGGDDRSSQGASTETRNGKAA